MDTNRERIMEGLKAAIQSEADGHHFYMMASRSAEDPKAAEVFAIMAQEEKSHAGFLRKQYQSFLDTGAPDPAAVLPGRKDLSGASPIFSSDIKARIGEMHIEMSALSIALKLELDAERFYRDQARLAGGGPVTAFYSELADWESEHYQALKRQMDEVKEDYWQQGGFAPF